MLANEKFEQIVGAINQYFGRVPTANGAKALAWLLFLKYSDQYETAKSSESEFGSEYETVIKEPFRWDDWAVPKLENGKPDPSRQKDSEELVQFVEGKLFPHFREIVSESNGKLEPNSMGYRLRNVFRGLRGCVVDGNTLRKLVDIVDQIDFSNKEETELVAKNYEKFLQNTVEKSIDVESYFTRRPVIRAIVNTIRPGIDETIYDPAAGTCGFYVETLNYLKANGRNHPTELRNSPENDMFIGMDHMSRAYIMGLTNLLLHGISSPHYLWNSALAKDIREITDDQRYDIVLSNIPFGRKVKPPSFMKNFPIEHEAVDLLFLQHILASVKDGGRAAIILPEGMLRRADKEYIQVRKKLMENFDVHTILSLPADIFSPASPVKPNVVYFDKKNNTSDVWYYECDKKMLRLNYNQFSDEDLEGFVKLFPTRETTEHSWTVTDIGADNDYNLAPKNPSKANRDLYSVSSYLEKRKPVENELKSQLLEEIDEMFVNYLTICFKKIKKRRLVEELLEVESGESLPDGERALFIKSDHPYLLNSNLTCKGIFDVSKMKYLPNDTYEKLKMNTISEVDLYVCAKETIGKTGLITPELNGANFADDAYKFVIKDRNTLDLKYLHLYSMTTDYLEQIDMATGYPNGPKLLLNRLMKLEIPVIPIEKQYELINKAWPVKEDINIARDFLRDEVTDEEDAIVDKLKFLQDLKTKIGQLFALERSTKLSVPLSTGGGGVYYESQVQAFFVLLMLTSGRVACLPSGTIQEIKFQGKVYGFNTDDFIVVVENKETNETQKVLGLIKRSIEFNNGKHSPGEVIQSFWLDFNNPKLFKRNHDSLTLVTSPLSGSDKTVQWLLEHAKHTKNSDEFFRNIGRDNFSPSNSEKKLEFIMSHLAKANGDCKVSNEETYEFLNHIHLLEIDFESKKGAFPSLIYSLISQYDIQNPVEIWANIVKEVQHFNQHARTITLANLSDGVQTPFKQTEKVKNKFKHSDSDSNTYWSQHPRSGILALLVLLGEWNVGNKKDNCVLKSLLGKGNYEKWTDLEKEIPNDSESPFSYVNGIWTVSSKTNMLKQLAGKIFDHEVENFVDLAVKVLKEPDPSLGRETEHLKEINSKNNEPTYSEELKEGMSEGLALLGNYSELFRENDCKPHRISELANVAIEKILKGATWQQWATLNKCLPNLAEASPKGFLHQVENALKNNSSSFSKLFQQKSQNMFGGLIPIRLTGIIWALETLAWDPDYLENACLCLAKLEKHIPSDYSSTRPLNSIEKILLPWNPHTLANLNLRIDTMEAIMETQEDGCWNLLLKLLHYPEKSSSPTSKPRWQKPPSGEFENEVSQEEYWDQVNACADLMLKAIGKSHSKLLDVINHLDHFPRNKISNFIEKLSSKEFRNLSDEEMNSVWNGLTKFTLKHREHQKADWSLPIEILESIENASKSFVPEDDQIRFKNLFGYNPNHLMIGGGTWVERDEKLRNDRKNAVKELYEKNGLVEILKFVDSVQLPQVVGEALAVLGDRKIDEELLPNFLDSKKNSQSEFISGYIGSRYKIADWKWADRFSIESWTIAQKTQFLLNLPFAINTWKRVSKWLKENEFEYWKNVIVYQNYRGDHKFAVEKFLQYGRPGAAVNCLWLMIGSDNKIESDLIIRTLMASHNSGDIEGMGDKIIVEIINQLHLNGDADEKKLMEIEDAYISSLIDQDRLKPLLLERKLATDPEYYSEIIQQVYRSNKMALNQDFSGSLNDELLDSKFKLLHYWSVPPGFENGSMNVSKFNDWISRVEKICAESGHLDKAMYNVGKVLARITFVKFNHKIPKEISEILNTRKYGDMRDGYMKVITNPDVVRFVDDYEAHQRLAKLYRREAKAAEKLGLNRLKSKLDDIAQYFEVMSFDPSSIQTLG